MPRTASVADFAARLSEYLSMVRQGEDVIVTLRGRPVARMVPVRHPGDEIDELVKAGKALRGLENLRRLDDLPIGLDPGGAVSQALQEERRAER